MRWPWQQDDSESKLKQRHSGQGGFLKDISTPNTLIATAILSTVVLTSTRLYRTRLKRIPTAINIPASYCHDDVRTHPKRHTLFGVVVRVSDGDGIRLYHTPGGRLTGWNWLRQVPLSSTRRRQSGSNNTSKPDRSQGSWLAENTINVRFSGIDAPELAHFGHSAQPGAEEATEFLKNRALHRWVRIYPHSRDQYGRVVATVFVSDWHLGGWLLLRRWKDAGADVVRAGWATVYEGKFGAMFGGADREKMLQDIEHIAKQKQIGIWKGHDGAKKQNGHQGHSKEQGVMKRIWQWLAGSKKEEAFESPRDFKARMKKQDEEESQRRK